MQVVHTSTEIRSQEDSHRRLLYLFLSRVTRAEKNAELMIASTQEETAENPCSNEAANI